MHRVFLSGSVDLIAAAHPRVITASLCLSPMHTLTLFHSAHQRAGSLSPNCNACFCSILGSECLGDLCPPPPHPLLSDPEIKPVESIGPGRELFREAGVSGSESSRQPASPPPPSGSGRAQQLMGGRSGARLSGTQWASDSILGCVTLGHSAALSWPQFSDL